MDNSIRISGYSSDWGGSTKLVLATFLTTSTLFDLDTPTVDNSIRTSGHSPDGTLVLEEVILVFDIIHATSTLFDQASTSVLVLIGCQDTLMIRD